MGIRGRAAALAALAVVLAGCGGSSKDAAPPATTTTAKPAVRSPFEYDRNAPLDYRDTGRVNGAYPIAVHDISYSTPNGDRVEGFLTLPRKVQGVPAVIYLHGSGESRDRFLYPATWAAAHRAVGMTLTLPSSNVENAPNLTPEEALARQKRIFVDDVVAVRRAIDVLRTLPEVDPDRIGVVGWSLGARVGAVLAGAEPRLKSVVLMSGGAQPVSAYVAQAPVALQPKVKATLDTIDPIQWIARGKPGAILIQDGRKDEVVPRSALEALRKAAPKGTTVRWYPTGHELNPKAYRDQMAFLKAKLPFDGPNVAGADTGP